jgi:hypothetical protein
MAVSDRSLAAIPILPDSFLGRRFNSPWFQPNRRKAADGAQIFNAYLTRHKAQPAARKSR